jgi:uncharacterized membrane protein YuzA (DUF378 family)
MCITLAGPTRRWSNTNSKDGSPLAAEAWGFRGLVVEDLLDLFHHLVGQLGDEIHRFAVVLDLVGLGGLYVLSASWPTREEKCRLYLLPE